MNKLEQIAERIVTLSVPSNRGEYEQQRRMILAILQEELARDPDHQFCPNCLQAMNADLPEVSTRSGS